MPEKICSGVAFKKPTKTKPAASTKRNNILLSGELFSVAVVNEYPLL
jgi:hypothetical protein